MNRVLDSKGRWRSKTVAFRISPQEDEMLEKAVALSGMTKQDYIISRLQNKQIIVMPNSRVYKALSIQMSRILQELQSLKDGKQDADLLETIALVAKSMEGLKGGQSE